MLSPSHQIETRKESMSLCVEHIPLSKRTTVL